MSYVKPLTIAAALVLGLTGMDAFAGTKTNDIVPPQQSTQKSAPLPTYFIADAGTKYEHKVYYFNRLDRNHDGQLSRSEIPKDMWRLRAYFSEADFDGNGKISLEEYYMWKMHTAPEYVTAFHIPTFVYNYHNH